MRQFGGALNIPGVKGRFVVELEGGSPPSGRVIAADGSSIRFAGWTELAQALTSDAESADQAVGAPSRTACAAEAQPE